MISLRRERYLDVENVDDSFLALLSQEYWESVLVNECWSINQLNWYVLLQGYRNSKTDMKSTHFILPPLSS